MEKNLKYLPKGNPSKKWFKNITDYYITSVSKDEVRDLKRISDNQDLINGMLDSKYFNTILNPLELKQAKNNTPINDEIIPVILPSINTLIGEVYERNIDFRAYVMNPSAVSEKEKWLQKEFNKRLQSIIENQELTEEEMKLRLFELKQWKDYDSQDIRERMANHILKDHMERLKFQKTTKEGWKEMLYNSEEIYLFKIVNNNVVFKKLNSLEVSVYGLPDTGEIHKSEAIVYQRYMTIGEIITEFGKELKKKDLDRIVEGNGLSTTSENGIIMLMDKEFKDKDEGMLDLDVFNNTMSYNQQYSKGKIMVKTVYFKVLKKIHDLYYIDEITGEEKTMVVPDDYEVNEAMGEHLENTRYINEYWESTRILDDIYVEQKQCDVQMRDINDKSLVIAPIVGKVLLHNNKVEKSIVDNLKPIQYQWTAYSKKLSMLWARNFGKVLRLDVSKIPKKYGFDVDLFMSWIVQFGFIIEDPFNEAMKGQPAGQFGSSVQAVDMELSSSISQALQYMVYLRSLADEIVGVPRQRRGDLMASDGLGTTQESITRSFKITEELFQEHYDLQKTLLYVMLEYAKTALTNDGEKKMQYITDEASFALYDADPKLLNNVDVGIFIGNTKKQMELEQVFLQLAHAYAQNGAIKMSEIMDLYRTNSMAERINIMKLKEKELELRQEQQQKAQQEHEKILEQMRREHENKLHQYDLEIQQLKNEGIIAVAQIQTQGKIESELIKQETDLEEADVKADTEKTKSAYQYNINKNKNQNK